MTAAVLGLLASLIAQPPAQPRPEEILARDLVDLERVLADEPGQGSSRAAQMAAIQTLLARHGGHSPADPRLLCLRARLGSMLLHAADAPAALTEFELILTHAPAGEHDLRGRALYGKAQVEELQGKVVASQATLTEIVEAHAGQRYARFATVALERLRRRTDASARNALDVGPLVDLDGRVHRLREDPPRAGLLVFWTPDSELTVARLRGVLAAWKRAGGEKRRCFAFALGADQARIKQAVKELALDCTVIACDDEFLDPAVLAASVTKLPTTLLLGPDGAVLARDQSLGELERVAARLH